MFRRATSMGERVDIRLPVEAPETLLELVDFLEQLNGRMRRLRDESPLPRSAVTLPDEFDALVGELVSSIGAQARAARDAGESLTEVRIPLSDGLADLARWAEPRMDLLAGLTRAGLVQPEWERPLKLTIEMFESVLARLPDD